MIVSSSGSYLPGEVVTNDQLAEVFGDGVYKMGEYFGVHGRHFTVDYRTGENCHGYNSDFGVAAVGDAIRKIPNFNVQSIDLIVTASTTPDDNLPTLSSTIQDKLGILDAIPIDIRGGCSGPIQALLVAKLFLDAGLAKTAVVIGGECCSPLFYQYLLKNRSTAGVKDIMNSLIFGDGAGAMILESRESKANDFQCIVADFQSTMASLDPGFIFALGGTKTPVLGKNPPISTLFRHASKQIERYLPELIQKTQSAIHAQGYTIHDFSHVIGPQANHRLVRDMNALLKDHGEYYYLGDKIGNVPSGALVIAFDHMVSTQNIAQDAKILLMGMETPKWMYGYCIFQRGSVE